jgi:hypothetical protein
VAALKPGLVASPVAGIKLETKDAAQAQAPPMARQQSALRPKAPDRAPPAAPETKAAASAAAAAALLAEPRPAETKVEAKAEAAAPAAAEKPAAAAAPAAAEQPKAAPEKAAPKLDDSAAAAAGSADKDKDKDAKELKENPRLAKLHAFLQHPRRTLFLDAKKPVSPSVKDASFLADCVSDKNPLLAVRELEQLEAHEKRFDSVAELASALRSADARESQLKQRLLAYLTSACPLFADAKAEVKPTAADVERILDDVCAGPFTMSLLKDMEESSTPVLFPLLGSCVPAGC